MIKAYPNQKQINKCQSNVWDFGNQILYDLCRNDFDHKEDDKIITKVIFIGRIYAAAVERRRNKTDQEINDDFYTSTIAPKFKESQLDEYLNELKGFKSVTSDNLLKILTTHNYLLLLLKQITDLEKRSFCSKYLHFHLPELFFIYDSRAINALRLMISRIPMEYKSILTEGNIDHEYTKFFLKCLEVKDTLDTEFGVNLSNRQFDNLLILLANDLQRKK